MEIEEYKAAKRNLELKMKTALRDMINEFHAEAGVAPHDIDVAMIETSQVQDEKPSWLVADVKVHIDI